MFVATLLTGCLNATTDGSDELLAQLAQQAAAIEALQARIEELESDVDAQGSTISTLETDGGSYGSRISTLESESANLATMVRVIDGDLVLGSESQTNGVPPERSGEHSDVIVAGANLYVINGAGSTATANGLGNLVLGYDEIGYDPENADTDTDIRTGSHNLVLGPWHTYMAWGAVIVGADHYSDDPGSVVVGQRNSAFWSWTEGSPSSVGGDIVTGADNVAYDAGHSVIAGGNSNRTFDTYDAIFAGNGWQVQDSLIQTTVVGYSEYNNAQEELPTWIGGGLSTTYLP